MRSTMQDVPLSIRQLMTHGTSVHAASEVVTATPEGSRRRSYGEVGYRAARLANGLRSLGVTGDDRWLARAQHVADRALSQFDAGDGGWYDTAADAEELLVRPRDVSDNATPSGTSALAHGLIALCAVTGDHAIREAAVRTVASAATVATGAARFAGWTLAAAEALHDGPADPAPPGPRVAQV